MMNLLLNPFKFGKEKKKSEPKAAIYPAGTFWGGIYDGEQEPFALNSGYVYDVDYYELARRAYTLVTINEFARIMILRLTEFVVGTGLRLHPTPLRGLLKRMFNIVIPEDFSVLPVPPHTRLRTLSFIRFAFFIRIILFSLPRSFLQDIIYGSA